LPESQHQVRFPILAPPRPTSVHEVASASDLGRRQRRNEDAVSVFALSLPQDDLDIVVLAVADGLAEHARGSGTSMVAVEAFGDALGGLVGSLQIGPRWQFGLAEIVETAIAETNAKVRAMKPNAKGQPAATTLTAAVLAGDWLCAAHLGNSRVYRLSGNELEQLTEDHAREPLALLSPPREDMLTVNDTGRLASALGVTDVTTPGILFRRIAPGDVVLVCSDGLHEQVDGDELARLLNAQGSLEEIAASLVSAANARGGDDNISVCLARVGKVTTRLPEPDARAERLYGDVAATILPRYQAEVPSQWLPDRIGLVAGLLLSLAVLAGFVYWDEYRAKAGKAGKAAEAGEVAATGQLGNAGDDSSWTAVPQPAPVTPTPVQADVPEPVAVVRDSDRVVVTAPEPAPAPVVPAPSKPLPSAATADSIAAAEALKREAAQAKLRRVRDSLVEDRMATEERNRRDSVALAVAAATRVAEQRARDSTAAAEKRKRDSIEAQERVEAQARAAALAEDNRRKQDELKATRLASGRTALNGWLTRLVAAVSAGEARAAVMTAGPSSFVAFVEKNGPKISDASMTSVEVDDASGEATATWTLKWKSNFGTSTTKRVKASATVVRDGETWRLLGWKILEGEP
jgi:serine/threonine protein phosphatase PrpC